MGDTLGPFIQAILGFLLAARSAASRCLEPHCMSSYWVVELIGIALLVAAVSAVVEFFVR
jgi:hypothetical protein